MRRNWWPFSARSRGRRRATELGLAGRDVVMSHPALLFVAKSAEKRARDGRIFGGLPSILNDRRAGKGRGAPHAIRGAL
jgi:hypothetical protein